MKKIIILVGAGMLCASAASAQQFNDRAPFEVSGPLTEDRVLVDQNNAQFACKIRYGRKAAVLSECLRMRVGRVETSDRQPTEPRLPQLAGQVARIDEIAAANMALEVLNKLTCQAGAKSVPAQLYRTQLRSRLLQELGAPARVDAATDQALDAKISSSTEVVFKYNRAKWLIDKQFIGPTRCQ
jgi:hypothetical protein